MHRRTRSLTLAILLPVLAAGIKAQLKRDSAPVSSTAVHPLFDWTGPDTAPFPSDRFTVTDDRNLTRRRVSLPTPADCVANKSECEDVDVLNQLDGFSLRPRVTIPFDGDIDPATVKGNVFFVSLGDTTDNWTDDGPASVPSADADQEHLRSRPGFGRVININQIVWDPATRVLAAKADRLLDEHTRYALVVTNGILDSAGRPVTASVGFGAYPRNLAGSNDAWYRKTLLAADWAARHFDVAQKREIVALSSLRRRA